MADYLLQHFPSLLLSLVGLILAELLRRAIKGMKHATESLVRGNLAFHEVAERKPEYLDMFESWRRGGDIGVRSVKSVPAGK